MSTLNPTVKGVLVAIFGILGVILAMGGTITAYISSYGKGTQVVVGLVLSGMGIVSGLIAGFLHLYGISVVATAKARMLSANGGQRGYTTLINALLVILVVLAIIILGWIILSHITTK